MMSLRTSGFRMVHFVFAIICIIGFLAPVVTEGLTISSPFNEGERTDERTLPSPEDGQEFTTNQRTKCPDKFYGKMSHEEILHLYKGLFHSNTEMRTIQKKKDSIRQSSLLSQFSEAGQILDLPGDGDACCATEVTLHTNTTLMNVDNQERHIIHLTNSESEPVYQFIPHGRCVNYGQCESCVQENTMMSLLVYDPSEAVWPFLTFDLFSIPGYCSCKNPGI